MGEDFKVVDSSDEKHYVRIEKIGEKTIKIITDGAFDERHEVDITTDQARALGLALVKMTEPPKQAIRWFHNRPDEIDESWHGFAEGDECSFMIEHIGPGLSATVIGDGGHDSKDCIETIEEAKAWCENHPWRKCQ